jgi:hypothetical protein
MTFHALLAWVSALLSGGLVVFALCTRGRTFVHWAFALGMSAVAFMEAFKGVQVQSVQLDDIIYWKYCSSPAWQLVAV